MINGMHILACNFKANGKRATTLESDNIGIQSADFRALLVICTCSAFTDKTSRLYILENVCAQCFCWFMDLSSSSPYLLDVSCFVKSFGVSIVTISI